MPAGTSYLVKEGMLAPKMLTVHHPAREKEYVGIEMKNYFLHAVHPLAWIKKISLEVDGEAVSLEDACFVLRGQWFGVPEMPTVTEVYWNLAEKALLCLPKHQMPGSGKHRVKLIFEMSMLEDTQVMDDKDLWPRRIEFVEDELEWEDEP